MSNLRPSPPAGGGQADPPEAGHPSPSRERDRG